MANFTGVGSDSPSAAALNMTGPITYNSQTGIVAKAGGGQSGATQIAADISVVGTVATAGDSVLLPSALPGRDITIVNTSANSLNVFPATGNQINALGANAAFAMAAGKTATFVSALAGQWYALLSA